MDLDLIMDSGSLRHSANPHSSSYSRECALRERSTVVAKTNLETFLITIQTAQKMNQRKVRVEGTEIAKSPMICRSCCLPRAESPLSRWLYNPQFADNHHADARIQLLRSSTSRIGSKSERIIEPVDEASRTLGGYKYPVANWEDCSARDTKVCI